MPKETELKLQCDAADLDELAGHPRLKGARSSDVSQLKTVYFDTHDRKLRGAGLALRIRERKHRFVQTLKASSGTLARSEWETPVAGPYPDRKALPGAAAKLLKRADVLEPAFSVAVQRRSFLVHQGGSRIEVALDLGRIDAGPEAGPANRAFATVSELELELKDGAVADLFALADELGERAAFTFGVQSKSERGYALGDPAADGAAHADFVDLERDMTAAGAFQTVAHSAIRQLRLNETILMDRRDPEALHQARVAVRRLRSAFSLFGALVDDAQSRRLRADLKRLSAPLGVARNLDVFLAETLPAERRRRPDESGLLNLEKTLETERAAAYQTVDRLLRSAEWRGLALDIVAWLHAGPWLAPADKAAAAALAQPARTFAGQALEKRLRQVRRRGRGLATLTPEARHEVRIAAKKLRYGVEFFGSLYGGDKARRLRSFRGTVKRLQGALGDLNDIATARDLAEGGGRRAGPSALFAAGLTAGDVGAGSQGLIADARAARKSLLKARPFWR